MSISYRISQFWHDLTAKPALENIVVDLRVLSTPLLDLFSTLQPGEQAHGLRIYHEMRDKGETCPDLLVAALLHDVGKNRFPLQLWQRVVIVLGKSLFPNKVKHWSRGDPDSWRRPFVVAEKHAAWGAEMVMRAGATSTTVKLIERHHDPIKKTKIEEDNQLLYRLQLLDDRD